MGATSVIVDPDAGSQTPVSPRLVRLRFLVAGPILYAAVAVLAVLFTDQQAAPTWVVLLAFVLKPLTMLSLVVLAGRLGRLIAFDVRRTAMTAVVWVTGSLLVLAATTAVVTASDVLFDFGCRVWPGGDHQPNLAAFTSDQYTATTVIGLEAAAVVAVALVAAITASLMGRKPIFFTGVATGFSTLVPLLAYSSIAPWSFALDYDTFVGDALLGMMQLELLFFVFPFGLWDGTSAVAFAVAAIVTAGLISRWEQVPERS